jgi:metal-dependent amidase/aminoacylase/carboxypeptidase family protein
MEKFCATADCLAHRVARDAGLAIAITYQDVFAHCKNDPDAVARLRRALDAEKVPHGKGDLPMRASEDFGRFGACASSAMFFLGAGEGHPSLHNPDYDYPDDLIAIGARVLMRTLRDLLG